jgi:beta-phosphoglucomutase-like phosphatase (HAD superfamily)
MTSPIHIDPDQVDVLLCDVDGNLLPSEELAFIPAAGVVNSFMEEAGSDERFQPEGLRREATGVTFRMTLTRLAAERDIALDERELERWVAREREAVTEYLARTLTPNPWVIESISALAERHRLAAVSSSALTRLDTSLEAAGLGDLFPPEACFSAEDSLPEPRSKPDPAIYRFAVEQLGAEPTRCLAVEDSIPGVESATGAGVPVVGNVVFVPPGERAERRGALLAAGAAAVVSSWSELEGRVLSSSASSVARSAAL